MASENRLEGPVWVLVQCSVMSGPGLSFGRRMHTAGR